MLVGANSYGQLGQGHTEDQLLPRQLTDVSLKLQQVGGGGGHTLVVTEDGDLLTCGSNNKGQLGLGKSEDVMTLSLVLAFQDTNVTMATGGWDFSLAVTDKGKLYSWGSNGFGQLGDPDIGPKSDIPVKVTLPDDQGALCQVAAGLRHSVALSASGRVYCWGHGKKGQCGILVDGKPPVRVPRPTEVTLPTNCGAVIQICAGSYHTVALTSTGNILLWGCNKFGQATQDPKVIGQVNQPYMVTLDTFAGSNVEDIRSGWTHLMAMTEDGSIFSWGRGDYGQLGRSHHTSCDHTPRQIDTLHDVKSLQCGSEHSMAISADGRLVSWGWNEHGMCGTGGEDNVLSPRTVTSLADNHTVINIGCGAGHCFAVTQKCQDNG